MAALTMEITDTTLSLNTQKQKGKSAAEVENIPKSGDLRPLNLFTTLVTDEFLTSLNLR